MPDPTDHLIEAAVACRECGMKIDDVMRIAVDVYNAPWNEAEPLPVNDNARCFVPVQQEVLA